MTKGLSSEEAKKQLRTYGLNQIRRATEGKVGAVFLDIVKEPMIFLLIMCSVLYFIIGGRMEGIVLFAMVGMVIGISLYQKVRSDHALEELKRLSAPKASVYRDGVIISIPALEVVPEDVCVLSAGDRIPADGILLKANQLLINEAILTGESIPVEKNMNVGESAVYCGTMVLSGNGLLLVKATGDRTRIGEIGKKLVRIKKSESPLQKSVQNLVRIMGSVALVVTLILVSILYFRSTNLVQSLLSGLATAMALIPEEFPVILSVFIAIGAWRLSRINVLMREPRVVEILGSANILCVDKTGTITHNKIILEQIVTQKNTFSLNEKQISSEITELLKILSVLYERDSTDPIENAIRKATSKTKISSRYQVRHVPFNHHLRYSKTALRGENKKEFYFLKGAPEVLLNKCSLSKDERKKLELRLNDLIQEGFRVLAVIRQSEKQSEKQNEKQNEKQSENESSHLGSKEKLVCQFICFLAFSDPIRQEVPSAIQECKSAGIRVIMMTGDHSGTAIHIAKKIGIENSDHTLTGIEIDNLNDQLLIKKLKDVRVLSRVDPMHKLRIVQLLKRGKNLVAMTGDGVNDAPSLKAAHIGIAMGIKGTDVAREASSIVLMDDNFASIVSGIKLGRMISDNLEKAMSYALSVHIPIILLTLIPLFGSTFPLLLLPIHVVFMELIIDPVSSIAFETQPIEQNRMTSGPKRAPKHVLSSASLRSSIVDGMLVTLVVLCVFFLIRSGEPHEEIRAVCFYSLITSNSLLALSRLSNKNSVITTLIHQNLTAKLILLFSFITLIGCMTVPLLQHIFQLRLPSGKNLAIASAIPLLLLLIIELRKLWRQKRLS
jgi:Ca2+-transporting ATPase